jgi:hypothetical protein
MRYVGDLEPGTRFVFTGDRSTARRGLIGTVLERGPEGVRVCVTRTYREGNDKRAPGVRMTDTIWWSSRVAVEVAPGRAAGKDGTGLTVPPVRFVPRPPARRFT